MTELSQLVDKLISVTRKGLIEWENHSYGWILRDGPSMLIVYRYEYGPSMLFKLNPEYPYGRLGRGDDLNPIVECLMEISPPRSITREEAMQYAHDCLGTDDVSVVVE